MKHRTIVIVLLLLNFLIRLVIYYNTNLFSFSDYSAYLGGIDNIDAGHNQYLLIGNFLFAISYIGYFAREIMGSLDWFFIFNCLLGSGSGLIIYWLIVKITGLRAAGIIALIILTLYTEFMVFSSVFYTPVIMIFLLLLFLMMLWFFLTSPRKIVVVSSAAAIIVIFLLTFFFKPELKFLPLLFLIAGITVIKQDRRFMIRLLSLSFLLFTFSFLFGRSGIITAPEGNTISNAFVFFGHTGYGGDGGEGSFVYSGNRDRYEAAAGIYFAERGIINPNTADYNAFQSSEIKKFITEHPVKWAGLQAKKFFRTFGVVPETNSFKVLYTGLLKGRLWLTSFVVVAPVAVIILLFIILFRLPVRKAQGSGLTAGASAKAGLRPGCRNLIESRAQGDPQGQVNERPQDCNPPERLLSFSRAGTARPQDKTTNLFVKVYVIMFFYYITASIFYGHYQERYRLPIMVVFIIPALGYFIATADRKELFKRAGLYVKGVVLVLFLTVWVFQVRNAAANRARYERAVELVISNQ